MIAIEPLTSLGLTTMARAAAMPAPSMSIARSSGFTDLLVAGLRDVDARVTKADHLVRSFAVGDPIPLHQITIALEQARLSVDLAMEVRARLVENYRDFMNMQV